MSRYSTSIGLSILVALTVVVSPAAQAQTFQVLYNFTGAGGSNPDVGVTMDAAGNLYGPAGDSIYKLTYKGSGWIFNHLCRGQRWGGS
jgi:hypothetical protein